MTLRRGAKLALNAGAIGCTPVSVGSEDVAPNLLLGETLDGATPFEGSLEARRRFPNSVLIGTVGGTTHANGLAGNACVDERIAEYLATGELPQRIDGDEQDVSCDPLPLPEPTTAMTYAAPTGNSSALRLSLQHAAVRHR